MKIVWVILEKSLRHIWQINEQRGWIDFWIATKSENRFHYGYQNINVERKIKAQIQRFIV